METQTTPDRDNRLPPPNVETMSTPERGNAAARAAWRLHRPERRNAPRTWKPKLSPNVETQGVGGRLGRRSAVLRNPMTANLANMTPNVETPGPNVETDKGAL